MIQNKIHSADNVKYFMAIFFKFYITEQGVQFNICLNGKEYSGGELKHKPVCIIGAYSFYGFINSPPSGAGTIIFANITGAETGRGK
jgi:hypothetical protein